MSFNGYDILATRATMATHGQLGPFDSAHEDWDSYVERLQLYCTANDIEDAEKRRAILLSTCGASTYRTIKNVLSPRAPTDVSFNDFVKEMSAHLQPRPVRNRAAIQVSFPHSQTRRVGGSVRRRAQETFATLQFCNSTGWNDP